MLNCLDLMDLSIVFVDYYFWYFFFPPLVYAIFLLVSNIALKGLDLIKSNYQFPCWLI